jgi:hypothetical protein
MVPEQSRCVFDFFPFEGFLFVPGGSIPELNLIFFAVNRGEKRRVSIPTKTVSGKGLYDSFLGETPNTDTGIAPEMLRCTGSSGIRHVESKVFPVGTPLESKSGYFQTINRAIRYFDNSQNCFWRLLMIVSGSSKNRPSGFQAG